MRTTVTLDADVKALLAAAAFRNGKSFKAALNEAVRAGLARELPSAAMRPAPQWPVFDMGSPLVDLTKAAALADELADREALAKLKAGR